MGGHGGLNILPQKRWNVYNFDNREKVLKDEESAAKNEQIARQQSRHRDSALRIQQLRRDRGLAPPIQPPFPAEKSIPIESDSVSEEQKLEKESKHINLFEGIRIFDAVMVDDKKRRRREEEEENDRRKKMMKQMQMKKEEVREIGPEDEKYKLGYGVAGKGVVAPWYAVKKRDDVDEEEEEERERNLVKKSKKKTVEELREERLKREMAEKERQRALLSRNRGGADGGRIGGNVGYSRESRYTDRRQWR